MRSYKHSGDAGDSIYACPAIRVTGGGTLFLAKADFTRVQMDEKSAANIRPLLEAQPYIKEVLMWHGQAVAFDLDLFRYEWNLASNIAEQHLKAFGLPLAEVNNAWLTVDSNTVQPVVINRTARYRNPHFPWRRVADKYRKDAVFVGSTEEHEDFCERFGAIGFYETANLLDLAEVIAGCKLFIGNQSTPYAIAEGLKKPVIQELCLACPNCVFTRRGAQIVAGERIELPEIEQL